MKYLQFARLYITSTVILGIKHASVSQLACVLRSSNRCARLAAKYTFVLATTCVLGTAWAAEPPAPRSMTVAAASSSAESTPYWLLTPVDEQIRGNAAVYYGKVKASHDYFFASKEITAAIQSAQNQTLEELRQNEILRGAVNFFVGSQLHMAARCDSVDWQLPIGQVPLIGMPIPELGQCQYFGAWLNAGIRIKAADGEFALALKSARSSFALARSVGKGPTLGNVTVALAIQEQTIEALIDFVQQKDAPNLYWSLTALPSPLVNMGPAMQTELAALELTFPWLKEIESNNGGEKQWNQRLTEFWELMKRIGHSDSWRRSSSIESNVVFGYPIAKSRLTQRGYQQEFLDGLPVSQVLLMDGIEQCKRKRTDIVNWANLPFPVGFERVKQAEEIVDWQQEYGFADVANSSNINVSRVLFSAMVTEQKLNMLRVFEALRMRLASHGKLVSSLNDIEQAPCPSDPATGKSFQYRNLGQNAILEGKAFPEFTQLWAPFSRFTPQWKFSLAPSEHSANADQAVQ